MCRLLQLVLVLSDEHAVVQRFVCRQLGMGVTADDQIEPRIVLSHLYIILIAEV